MELKNVSVTDDSITISKEDLENLVNHYEKQVEFFWNPNPLSPQTWGVGLFQGKLEFIKDLLTYFDK